MYGRHLLCGQRSFRIRRGPAKHKRSILLFSSNRIEKHKHTPDRFEGVRSGEIASVEVMPCSDFFPLFESCPREWLSKVIREGDHSWQGGRNEEIHRHDAFRHVVRSNGHTCGRYRPGTDPSLRNRKRATASGLRFHREDQGKSRLIGGFFVSGSNGNGPEL